MNPDEPWHAAVYWYLRMAEKANRPQPSTEPAASRGRWATIAHAAGRVVRLTRR